MVIRIHRITIRKDFKLGLHNRRARENVIDTKPWFQSGFPKIESQLLIISSVVNQDARIQQGFDRRIVGPGIKITHQNNGFILMLPFLNPFHD